MKSTQRDLFKRALTLLGVAGSGQEPSAEDWLIVKEFAVTMLEELRSRDAANIALHPTDDDLAEIPSEYIGSLAKLLANEAAPAFGVASVSGRERDMLIGDVRKVTADGPRYFPQDVEYF